MADKMTHNPWKGLNYYVEGEIIYGRDVEILSLSQYIFNNTQTVLYGRSGIGKSSILNAGIFPKARLNGMVPVSIRLKHTEGNDYLEQIREALEQGGLFPKELLPAINKDGAESLWEFMHRHIFIDSKGEQKVPLLVFDQFEEIFTLQANELVKRDFFKQLGDLLNDVKPRYVVDDERLQRLQQNSQQETKVVESGAFKGLNLKLSVGRGSHNDHSRPRYLERPDFHIVFALREDFLSSLELYASSIPVMKDNRFGLLPLNEEQAADIIRLPRPGLVDDEVTKLIIEQVTGRTDFILDGIPEIEVDAAVLSLFLSRLYAKKSSSDPCITKELVMTSGGHIIHDFYVDSITSDPDKNEIISPASVTILEDQLLTHEGRRNNVSRSDLLASGISEKELRLLINQRKLLRQFHHGNDIRIEYIHDILCPIVKERRDLREQLHQQELERKHQEEEKRAIIEKAEKEALRIKKRNRRMILWAASILVLLAAVGSLYWYHSVYIPTKLHEKYYAEFQLVNGWPVGVNELSESERAKYPLYYKLSHIGDNPHDTDVEIMSSNSMLPSGVRINNWLEICQDPNDRLGTAFNDTLSKVKKLHFTGAEVGDKVARMELKDHHDNLLMLINYYHLNDREGWLNYTDANGKSMPIRDNGIDRVNMSWDSIGRIEYQRYYTAQGVAKSLHRNGDVAGYYRKYSDKDPNLIDLYLLNIYGLPNRVLPYNLKRTTSRNDTIITSYYKTQSLDTPLLTEAIGENGYSREEVIGGLERLFMPGIKKPVATSMTEYDNSGNPLKQTINGTINNNFPPVIKWEYKGDTGLPTQKQYLTHDNRPYGKNPDDTYRWTMEYDNEGNRTSERHYTKAGECIYSQSREITEKGNLKVISEILDNKKNAIFINRIDSILPNKTITTFYGADGIRINRLVPYWAEDSVLCHRKILEQSEQSRISSYYAIDQTGKIYPLPTKLNSETGRSTSFRRREIIDENGAIIKMEILDPEGEPVTRMMYLLQGGATIGRAAWGIDDTPVRCPLWEEEGFCYYKIFVSKDFDNSYVFLQPFDEWMNNSLFFDGEEYTKVTTMDLKDKRIHVLTGKSVIDHYFNKGFSIPIFDIDMQQSDLEFPYLHILSKECTLYGADLKDGDRIIRLGAWHLGQSREKLNQEWSKMSRLNDDMSIEVMRPSKDGFIRLERTIKGGSPTKLKSEYHFMKCSHAEKKYYETHI